MSQFDQVSVVKKANVYFDGKCVSHTVLLADGTRISVGVILPSQLTFNTGSPEVMELIEGQCKVRLVDTEDWVTYKGGQLFEVPGHSTFDIDVLETLHYVCHFG
ncbi:pyrimidine/purine nucleoside phosphorylase [Chitinivorax sp. B]|uniref:pyrimidine/purine nucleoside phosphorylase n=1 Tax=Chitinivorax sp. B TaxID=2502235 RepID=UPI0010F5700C|nr:pyrimidine/purine nucleoside phosphorylase [Chitinivorax sp. B]